MDINKAKGIVLASLFFITLLSSALPLKLSNVIHSTNDPATKLRYGRIMSLLNCFAGGVFLGTCLLDLFPEVQVNIGQVIQLLNIDTSFPAAEFLVVIGLFIVLIVEQISLDCKMELPRTVANDEREPLVGSNSIEYGSLVAGDWGHGHEGHHHHHLDVASNSSLRSMLLLIALSLHSIFEGLAIGLQDNVEEVLSIFVAVILHKCVIAFGLSLNLVQSNLRAALVVQLMLVFSLAAPLGLGLGMGLETISGTIQTLVLSGVLQGLACGTFLYVTFFEILPHELNSSDLRMAKMVLILLGFSASVLIVFLDPDTSKPQCQLRSYEQGSL